MSTDDTISIKRKDCKDGDISSLDLPTMPLPLSMQGGNQETTTEELLDIWYSSQEEYSPQPTPPIDDESVFVERTEVRDLDVSSLDLSGGSTKVVYDPNDITVPTPEHEVQRRASTGSDTITINRSDNMLVDVKAFRTSSVKAPITSNSSAKSRLTYTPSPSLPQADDGMIHVYRSEVSPHIEVGPDTKPSRLPKSVVMPSAHPACDDADRICLRRSSGSGSGSGCNISLTSLVTGTGSTGASPSPGSVRSQRTKSYEEEFDDSTIHLHRSEANPHIPVSPAVLAGVASVRDAGLIPARRGSASSTISDDSDNFSIHMRRSIESRHICVDPSALANSGVGVGLRAETFTRSDSRIQVRREDADSHIATQTGVCVEGGAASSVLMAGVQKKKRWSFADGETAPQIKSPSSSSSSSDGAGIQLPKSVLCALGMAKKEQLSSVAEKPADAGGKPKRLSWTSPTANPPSTGGGDEDVIVVRRSEEAHNPSG